MEQESNERVASWGDDGIIAPSHEAAAGAAPTTKEAACPSCSNAAASTPVRFVYAIGRIVPRFPLLSVEKEFAQATGRSDTAGQTDQQALASVLSKPENRYLARQLCWVLTIQGLDTYILQPRDSRDFDRFLETLRPQPSPLDVDVVIGLLGPIAPQGLCGGLMVPMVLVDQLYSFDRESFVKAIPKPGKKGEEHFEAVAAEVFDRISQLTDNSGATDEHRALNYLAMRYPAIYAKAAEEFARDFSLAGVEVRPSYLSGTRTIVEVIFAYANRETDFTEKFFVRVDVTEEFPFLVTKLSPYYDLNLKAMGGWK